MIAGFCADIEKRGAATGYAEKQVTASFLSAMMSA